MNTIHEAICVYAGALNLKFLNPVCGRMTRLLGDRLTVIKLKNRASHGIARDAMRKMPQGLVIIFAHGAGDYLLGGDYRNSETSEELPRDKFFTDQDVHLFKNKVVFCLSCNSNGFAKASVTAGAIAFVGFGEVPFNRFDENGKSIGSDVLIKHTQQLLASAIQATLEVFLAGRLSLDGAVDYLRLWISKYAVDYVRRNNTVKERREVAGLLMQVRDGVRYHGELGIRFV